MLMAAGSSLRAGLTAHGALERACRMLPTSSPVRLETELLLENLSKSISLEEALGRFASSYRIAELDLFRRALVIMLRGGGKLSPSLLRLAKTSRERQILVEQARVSTTTMRMTANILLALAPIMLITLSTRVDGFWHVLATNKVANSVATLGALIIVICIVLLRQMSNFRP